MTETQQKINIEVNQLLRNGLKVAMQYEAVGEIDTANAILAITSQVATKRLVSSGISQAMKDFWNDKRAMVAKEAI